MDGGDLAVWGVRNNDPHIDFVEENFVALESRLGDFLTLSADLDALKAALTSAYPEAKAGAIPQWAGITLRFASGMAIGDLIVHPHKPDSTIAIGRITSDYRYQQEAHSHRHRRSVDWLRTGIPRTEFSQEALYGLGPLLSVFKVKAGPGEFLAAIGQNTSVQTPQTPEATLEASEETVAAEPTADRIREATRDFIIRTLVEQLDGYQFEHFVANLFEAMGYRTRVTPPSGDGGVDVLAASDLLGLQPPIIKVQCKKTAGTIDGPVVQQLLGTLVHGGDERGVFVTLGGFTIGARQIARNRHDIRVIDGPELVDLVLAHYDDLDPKYRRLLPLRRVFVVDQDLVAG